MKMINTLFLIGVLSLVTLDLLAEENSNQEQISANRYEESTGWFFSAGYIDLDSENAFIEGIDDEAFYLNLGWEGHKGNFVYNLGMSGFLLSDNDAFSQTVEGIFGGTSYESSSASAFGVFGELGYSYIFESGNQSFDLLGGAEVLWAERSIANCSNCYSENINLDSGLYIKPRFRFYNKSGFVFSVAYQQYLSGDVDGGVSLSFSWHH